MDSNTKDILNRPFDRAQIRERKGPNGRVLAYVAIGDYIARLNEAFADWNYEITETRLLDDEAIVQVRLSAGGMTKMGMGGAAITRRRDSAKPVSLAHDLMAAEATALKRAARLLGIGAALYLEEDDVDDVPRHQSERAPEPRSESPRITAAQLGKLRSMVPDWPAYRADVRQRHGVNVEFATKALASQLIDELVRANRADPRNNNGHGQRDTGHQAGGWRRA